MVGNSYHHKNFKAIKKLYTALFFPLVGLDVVVVVVVESETYNFNNPLRPW